MLKLSDLEGRVSTDSESASSICSLISANGEGVRLVSLFQPDPDLVLRLHPSTEVEISQADLEDWCCEFSNQLIGRLKTKLLTRGCEVSIGLPSVLNGEKISAANSQEAVLSSVIITSSAGSLRLTSLVQLDPEFQLMEEQSGAAANVMMEGEISLF
jgi:hypothetical protein